MRTGEPAARGCWTPSAAHRATRHAHDTPLIVAIWGTVGLKVAAALLPLLALPSAADGRRRITLLLAWVAAAILTVYGAGLTTVGLLVQADVIPQPGERRPSSPDVARLPVGSLVPTVGTPDRDRAAARQDPDAAHPGSRARLPRRGRPMSLRRGARLTW